MKPTKVSDKIHLMSREEKLAFLALMEEKRKRAFARKPKYTPNAGQAPVHACKAKERFVFSGNGSGKTALLVQEIYYAATGHNTVTGEYTNVPVRMACVVDNSKKITEVIIPEFRKWFDIKEDQEKRNGKAYTTEIIFPTGSNLVFYTAEADVNTFESVMYDYVFVDEPIKWNIYVALKRSLRIKGSPAKFLFCGTALGEAWLRQKIYEPWSKGELKDVECFRAVFPGYVR
jgi:hypothetical protein